MIYCQFQMLIIDYCLNMYLYVEEIQRDATVCRYLFTTKLLYMFRAFIAPIISSI